MDFFELYHRIQEQVKDLSKYSLDELEDLLRHAELAYKEYDNLQLVTKRNCNSLYGSTGNEHFQFCDVDIAEDITTICRHFAILVDIAINKYFASWHNNSDALTKIRKFYPDTVSLDNLRYVKDSVDDVCIYGDTDSRYIDLGKIMNLIVSHTGHRQLPPNTVEGNDELADFSVFLDKEFLQDIITQAIDEDLDYRGGNKGFLKMAHEVTTRKSVLLSKKMYIMPLIWKDGKKMLETPKMKYMGVSIKRGETTPQLKKIVEKLVYRFLVEEYTESQISKECNKIVQMIKMKNKKSIVCRSTSVSGVSELQLVKDEEGKPHYVIGKKHIQAQLIENWANFLLDNGMEKEYKLAFEKQKMHYYKTLGSKYKVIGVPDDVDIDKVPNLPPIDWHQMINQQFIKPLMKCLFDFSGKKDITDEQCNNFLTGIFVNKLKI